GVRAAARTEPSAPTHHRSSAVGTRAAAATTVATDAAPGPATLPRRHGRAVLHTAVWTEPSRPTHQISIAPAPRASPVTPPVVEPLLAGARTTPRHTRAPYR